MNTNTHSRARARARTCAHTHGHKHTRTYTPLQYSHRKKVTRLQNADVGHVTEEKEGDEEEEGRKDFVS